jgi:hypothetical protein
MRAQPGEPQQANMSQTGSYDASPRLRMYSPRYFRRT